MTRSIKELMEIDPEELTAAEWKEEYKELLEVLETKQKQLSEWRNRALKAELILGDFLPDLEGNSRKNLN